jgi:hypothetical protein
MGAASDIGQSVGRGTALLIDHCRRLDCLTGRTRCPARPSRERLERRIGADLAGGLVQALSGDHRLVRPRWTDRLRKAL